MLIDAMLLLATAGLGLKCSWASASGAVASAAAALLPLSGPPAGVAVLLISADTAFSAVGQLSLGLADLWKLLVDEGSAASVPEAVEVEDKTCIDEEKVKVSTLRAFEVPLPQSPVEVPWDAHLKRTATPRRRMSVPKSNRKSAGGCSS